MREPSGISTVQDLINELQKFPTDMEVRDYDFMEIEDVKIKTWHHDIIHMIDQIKIMYASVEENNYMNELTNEELFYAAKFNLPLFANHYTELERKRLKEKAANYRYEEGLKSEDRKRKILFGE